MTSSLNDLQANVLYGFHGDDGNLKEYGFEALNRRLADLN